MKKIIVVHLLFAFVFPVGLFAAAAGKDFQNAELTLNKEGFYYEEVIIITLTRQDNDNLKNKLIKEDKQFYDANNYSIYPQCEQNKPDKVIHPYQVKRGETASKIFLYVDLQQNTDYTLEVTPQRLAYETGEAIDIGVVSGINMKENFLKYLKYQTTKKLDFNADSSVDGELCHNFINTKYDLLSFNLSGKIYLNSDSVKDISSNNLSAQFNLQQAFERLNFTFLNFHAGCEATQDLTSKDVTAGVSAKFITPLPACVTFSKTHFSPFPEICLGYDIARTTSTDTNVNRLTYGASWNIPVNDKLIFDNTFSWIQEMHNGGNIYFYREQALYYRVTNDVNLTLVKVQEGRQPPLFEFSRTVTSGVSVAFSDITNLLK